MSKKKRITIIIPEDERRDFCSCDDLPEQYEFIQEEQIYFDTEKGYITMEAIIQDVTSKLFFMYKYSNWGKGDKEFDGKLTQVFPRNIIETVYE